MRNKLITMIFIMAVACPYLAVTADALTLAGYTTASPLFATNNPCPNHPGYNCRTTAHEAQVLPFGRNTDFETAWNTGLSREWDPAGWTLEWSATPLDITLNITTYNAYNYAPDDPQYGSFYAGAEIRIEWAPTPEQMNLRWIQAINTNRPRHSFTNWYLDILTITQYRPPLYPFQYTDRRFYDKPSRRCEAGESIFWDGYLYLATVDSAARHAVIYEGVYWGFSIDSTPVPEPSTVLALVCACGGIILKSRKRLRS